MSSPFRSSFRTIVAINVHLLTATGCAAIAWSIWPSAPEWWGLGVLSVLFGVTSVSALVKALGGMIALTRKDRVLHDYMARGGEPTPARMATPSDLKRAGMLDE